MEIELTSILDHLFPSFPYSDRVIYIFLDVRAGAGDAHVSSWSIQLTELHHERRCPSLGLVHLYVAPLEGAHTLLHHVEERVEHLRNFLLALVHLHRMPHAAHGVTAVRRVTRAEAHMVAG